MFNFGSCKTPEKPAQEIHSTEKRAKYLENIVKAYKTELFFVLLYCVWHKGECIPMRNKLRYLGYLSMDTNWIFLQAQPRLCANIALVTRTWWAKYFFMMKSSSGKDKHLIHKIFLPNQKTDGTQFASVVSWALVCLH